MTRGGWRHTAVMATLISAAIVTAERGPLGAQQPKGGEDETGPYEVVENWPQPWSAVGYIWGSQPGVFAESPNRNLRPGKAVEQGGPFVSRRGGGQ